MDFPGGTVVKNHLPVHKMQETQDPSLGSGRSPGVRKGNPLQYSCLEKSMDRGAWWTTVHRVAKSWTWLSTHIHARRLAGRIITQMWLQDKVVTTGREECTGVNGVECQP